MVQNSTASNSPLLDLSKVERQASGRRRYAQDPQSLNTFLQDIVCFFILLSLSLLIVASIFCVALNVHQTAAHQHGHRDNTSRPTPADGLTKQERRGPIWFRFFRCRQQQQQPQQDPNQEQVPEMEQVRVVRRHRHAVKPKEHKEQQLKVFPTYKPIDYSELAAGDSAKAEATAKESDSGPQALPVDKF